MPPEVFTTLQQWALALLLYPGLLFGLLFAISGEWLLAAVRSRLSRQRSRLPVPRPGFAQPAYDLLKLAGRDRPTTPGSSFTNALGLLAMLGPLLALVLMPLPGNPLSSLANAAAADILTILALLSVRPLVAAALRLRQGGLATLNGAHDLGRLLTALLPVLLVIAALVEVQGNRSLRLAELGAAPETAAQTLVRLLSAGVLLIALPWCSGREAGGPGESAGFHTGRLLQQVALSVLWALLVLPVPGAFPWAAGLLLGGAMLAYVAMRLVPERLWQGRSARGAAGMLWSAAVPLSMLALVIGLWWGA
ncbi:MAG TPA: hypothetical protein VND68_15040 [Chloroflexia bacterium]|nr:hypothetical protein [Chloroflexia bacterium]